MRCASSNKAGPVNLAIHYCLPPLERFDLQAVLLLIAQQQYFMLHAPRQTGKTSYLLALRDHVNAAGQYRCVYANVEIAQAAREDVALAMRAIVGELGSRVELLLRDGKIEGFGQLACLCGTGRTDILRFACQTRP